MMRCFSTKTKIFFLWLLTFPAAASLTGQASFLSPRVSPEGYAWGTGRTTGHIANLVLFNPSAVTLRTEVGPYLIPGGKGYQGYVVPRAQPVTLLPFSTVEVRLEGYCTDVSEPAPPRGEFLADLQSWATPAGSRLLPAPGPELTASAGWRPAGSAIPDSLDLAYPGMAVSFPYRIAIDSHPASVANLLLYAVRALEAAYDRTAQGDSFDPSAPGMEPDRRTAMVQQAFWYYTSRLEEKGYGRETFLMQVMEQAEQLLDRPWPVFTDNAARELLEKAEFLWKDVVGLNLEAGLLLAPGVRRSADSGEQGPASAFFSRLESLDPRQAGAFRRWQALRKELENAGEGMAKEDYGALVRRLNELLRIAFEQELRRLEPADPSTASVLFSLLELLDSDWMAEMDEEVRRGLAAQVGGVFQEVLEHRLRQLEGRGEAGFDELSELLLLFGSGDLAQSLEAGFVRSHREKLRRDYQARIVSEVLTLAPGSREEGGKILRLMELLALDYLFHGLGRQVRGDLLQQLSENWRLWMTSRFRAIDREREDVIDSILNLRYLLVSEPVAENIDYLTRQEQMDTLRNKLRNNLGRNIRSLEAPGEDALPALLFHLSRLARVAHLLEEDAVAGYRGLLEEKLNRQLRYLARTPDPGDERFLENWRANDQMRSYWWYDTHVDETTANLARNQQESSLHAWLGEAQAAVRPEDIPFGQLGLADRHWKSGYHSELPAPDSGKELFPLWVAGVPVSGAAAYFLLTGTVEELPLLYANDDLITISCGQAGLIDVLANDGGEGIRLQSFGQVASAVVTETEDGRLSVSVSGTGSFSIPYTITDKHGQTAEAVLYVQVTAPQLLAEDDAFSILAPNTLQENLLLNDLGPAPAVIAHTFPAGGSLTLEENGAFAFIPDASFCGLTSFEYTIGGACGQTASALVTLLVEDGLPPGLECPPPAQVDCGATPAPEITGEATASDNCGAAPVLSFTDEITAGTCAQEQNILRTWRATDAAGLYSECVQEIVQTDSAPPAIGGEAVISVSCGEMTDPDGLGMPEVSDNCTPAEALEINFADDVSGLNGCGGTGVIFRTWTVTDACGNTNEFVQEIRVADEQGPSLNCPPDADLDCDQSTDPAVTGEATATDDCTPAGALDLTYEDEEEPLACGGTTILRTWRATDACGNTTEAVQTITASDLTPPEIICPGGSFVSCEQSTEPGLTGQPTVTDNCDPDPALSYEDQLQSGQCINERLLTRTWRATDACGNVSECEQVITIGDITPPVLTLPPDQAIDCGEEAAPEITGQAAATDDCSGPDFIDLSYSDAVNPDGCAGESVILRTWTATDPCGNSVSGIQKITRTSGAGPVLTCPPNTIIDCSQPPLPETTGFPNVTGGCGDAGGFQTSYTDEQIPGAGASFTIRRTWSVTDPCGFAGQCTQLILVQNTDGATLTCPPDVTIDCSETPDPTLTGAPEITDNCYLPDEVSWDYVDDVSGLDGCGGTGQLVRNWMFVNLNGDVYTCAQMITFEDTTAPSIECPPDLTADVTAGLDPAGTGMASAVDDCGMPEELDLSYADDVSGLTGCAGTGELIRTWTATDACDNTGSCVQVITLQDEEPPVVQCPPAITVEAGDSTDPSGTGMPTGTDNATGAPDLAMTYSDDLSGLDGCGGAGVVLRTWTVTDLCGNFAACTQLITVEDTTPPQLTCPPDATVECGADLSPAQTGQATATDSGSAPGDIVIEFADNPDNLTGCNGTGFLQRTWTATDACGNAATCVQLITITDDTPPVIDCPPTANVLCGQQFDTGFTGEAAAADNCGGDVDLTFTDDLTNFDGCEGEIIRTWIATDACGHVAACEQSVLVTEVVCDFTPIFDTSPADCDQANGSITVTLDPPGDYTVEWETGDTGAQLAGLAGGVYALTITDDADDCSEVFQVVVDQGAGDFADLVEVTPADCGDSGDILLNLFGGDVFQVQVSGPDSLTLDDQPPGSLTLSDFMDVPPGLYTIEVTDAASGCSEALTAEVTSQAPFELTLEAFSDPTAPGASDGFITIEVIPAIFVLDIYVNGDYYSTEALPVFTVEDLSAGTYTIYAVDHNNPACQSNSVVVTLTDPAGLWTPEWTAAPDLRYLPEALVQRRLFSHWRTRPGLEGPGWGTEYRLHSFNGASVVNYPGRNWEVRLDLFRFGGDGRLRLIDPNAPGIRNTTDVWAEFQGLAAGLGVRVHPGQGRWQPWLGAGLTGSSWRSEYFSGGSPGEVRTGLDAWPYLSGGLRWSVWKKLAVELDVLIRATEERGKGSEVLPGLRGSWRW